jgi:hypothetical protein
MGMKRGMVFDKKCDHKNNEHTRTFGPNAGGFPPFFFAMSLSLLAALFVGPMSNRATRRHTLLPIFPCLFSWVSFFIQVFACDDEHD